MRVAWRRQAGFTGKPPVIFSLFAEKYKITGKPPVILPPIPAFRDNGEK